MRLTDFPRPANERNGTANHGMSMHLTAAADMPLGYDPDAAIRELVAMKHGWAKGLNLWNQDAGRRLLDAGIMPVHRPYQDYDGAADCSGENWERSHDLVRAGVLYQEPIWNEPNLEAGWGGDALSFYRELWPKWRDWAESILGAGGYPGTPAEAPGGQWGWRDGLWALLTVAAEAGALALFERGVWIAVHNYWSNHPTDYPYDPISQADHPGITLEQDSYAFLMPHEAHRVLETFMGAAADNVPVISTEGGPYVENRDDNRYPMTTLTSYSDMVLECREYMAQEAPPWWFCTNWWLHRWENGLGAPSFMKHAWLWSGWPNGRMPIVTALETLPALAQSGTIPPLDPEPPNPQEPPVPEPPVSSRWRLVSTRRLTPVQNHGRNLIIFEPPDVPMLVRWADGETVQTKDMWYGRGQYTVQVAGADSDVATVPGTDFPDEPRYLNDQGEWVLGNSNGHFSDVVTFEKVEETMPEVDWPGAEWVPSPNYEPRDGAIELIVLHWTGGGYAGSKARFLNSDPNQPGGRASAHYILDRDGAWHQFVRESDKAWHVGPSADLETRDINAISIGVEVVADADSPPTEAQYAALTEFVRWKASEYGITEAEATRAHREFTHTQCPGSLDVERVYLDAQAQPGQPADWNGPDWWQARSERERWLAYEALHRALQDVRDRAIEAIA